MNASHQILRFKQRYGKPISIEDYNRLNVLAAHSPQLRYTNIRCVDFDGMKVYVYMKGNRIATFLTESQAFRSQDGCANNKTISTFSMPDRFPIDMSKFVLLKD